MIDYVLLAVHIFVLCFHIIDMIVSHKKLSAICDKCGNTVTVSDKSVVLNDTQLELLSKLINSLKGD